MTTDTLMNLWLVCAAGYLVANIWPHKDIIKFVNGRPLLYLRRYYIWRAEWSEYFGWENKGNKYLHIILRSDDDRDPHTHPWDFKIKVLWGGYINELWKWRVGGEWPSVPTSRRAFLGTWPVVPGTIRYRSADHTHRVILHENKSVFMRMLFGQFKPAVTFVQTGPIKQHWSFITEEGPVPHWIYLGLSAPAKPTDENV